MLLSQSPKLLLDLPFRILVLFLCLQATMEQNTSNTTSEASTHILVPLNSRIYGNISIPDSSKLDMSLVYYKIEVVDLIPGEDLIIMAKPANRLSDPDLYISSTNLYPNSYGTAEMVCNAFGLDICVINASKITANSTFYVGVSCYQDCEYYLLAEYNSEVFLSLGQEVFIRYYESASEIAKIYIPKNDAIDQLIIYANIINFQQINETFHLYVNEGNEIPSTSSYDYISKEVWHDGKGVNIARNYYDDQGIKPLKTDCNYTVLVEGPAQSIILLIAEVFYKERALILFQSVHDMIDYQQQQTYKLTISDDQLSVMNKDPLIIELRVFSGDPDIYVHYDTLPDTLEAYKWSSTEIGNEALSLSKFERDSVAATSKVFYITVVGKFDSSYIIDTYYTAKNEDFLLFGETFTGSIITGELMNYRLNLFGDGEASVYLELKSETGNADLYVKRCSSLDKNECKIKRTDLENTSESGLWVSNNPTGMDTIRFYFNHSDCHFQMQTSNYGVINVCTYQVGVFGNSSYSESHYSLLAKHSQKHILLKEDEGFRSQLETNQKDYYKFHVKNASNIEEINFVVDCIAGDLIVLASKTNRFPNQTNYEKISFFELDYIKYRKDENNENSLEGTYYISIESFSAIDYIITPIIHRSSVNQNSSDGTLVKYSRLIDGEPVKRSSEKKSFRSYFKAKTTFNESQPTVQRTILINFKPISGSFRIFLSASKDLISETNFEYEMMENEMIFNSFTNSTVRFQILIVVDPNSQDQSYYKFELYYASSNKIIPLTYHPYYDTLTEDQTKFFMIYYDPQGPELTITRTIYTAMKNADVYVSLNQQNPYPDERYFDLSLTNNDSNDNSSSMTILQEELKLACQTKPCPMFISIYAYEDLLFSLLVRQNIVPVLINDGVLSKIPLPKDNEALHFYYFIPNNVTVTVFVDSFYVGLKTFVNIQKLENNEKSNWGYPSEFSYDYSYNTSYYSPGSIILKKNLFKSCEFASYGCALLISIKLNQAFLNMDASIKEFDLLITSQVAMLNEGRPTVGYVEKHMIKYYSIFVSQKDCVILVSVTPTGDGDPDIVASKGKDSRPTLDKYQWISNTYKADQLQITKEENKTMNGTYIIGVYGFTNTTFTITYMFEKQSIVWVRTGYPVDLNLKAGDLQYLEYYNMQGEFRVILNKNYGYGKIVINSINTSLDFIEQMPTLNSSSWSTVNNNRDIAYISEEDAGYCTFCNYVIGIYAERDSKFQIIISNEVDPIHLQSGQPLNDYIDKNSNNHYYYQTTIDSVTLSVLLYAGEIEIYVSNNATVSETNYYKKFTKADFKANELDVLLGKGYSLVPYLDEINTANQENIYRHSIMIKGVLETNYSITFSNTNEKKVLRFGVADYGSLESNNSQEYLFYGDENQILSLLLTVGNQAELSDMDTNSYILPDIEIIYQTNNNGEMKDANITKFLTTTSSLFYQISTSKGTYHINISNSNLEQVRYNLLVNSKDVELIIPGTETMQSLNEGLTHKYELYSPEPKKLFIEIFECLGKVQLQGSQNYLKMKKGDYDWEFEYPYENNHIIAFYEVQQGPVFIGVTAIEGYSSVNKSNSDTLAINEEALYVMKTHLLPPKGKIPQEKFFAGADGILNYQHGFINDNLRVSFIGVECANKCRNETAYLPIQYVYYLHVCDDQTILTSFSRCNMNEDAMLLFANRSKINYNRWVKFYDGVEHSTEKPIPISFDIELSEFKKGPIFFNVVAEIWVYDSINKVFEQFTIVYHSQEVYKVVTKTTEVKGFRLIWILMIIGGLLLIISLICCCYYRKRTKKFEKRLKYELSDIRNIAGGEIFEDKKPGNPAENLPIHYKGFLEEKAAPEET